MLDVEFLEQVADYYGGFTVEQFAEKLGLDPEELMEEVGHLIDANLDVIREEMGYDDEAGEA